MPISNWQANAWRHVAATWSASAAELKLYVDGAEVGRAGSWRPPAAQAGEAPLLVGHLQTGASGWDGDLDRVRVFERAVTAGEVRTEAARAP